MQLPWRPLRKPAQHTAGSWPPTATQWLLSALVLSLLAQWFLRSYFSGVAALLPDGALSTGGLATGRLWQPVSYLFAESGALLDFGALLALYTAGSQLEFIIGRRHLFQLFFLGGILGGLGQLAFDAGTHHSPTVILVGPTAAVTAVFLALTCVLPNLELAPLLGFPLPFWLKIKHCAFAVVLTCGVVPLLHDQGSFAREQAARCLVGCVTGCIYMRQLGFGRRARTVNDDAARPPLVQIPVLSRATESEANDEPAAADLPRFTERERRMTPREYISEQIDPILDKISLHGIGCLTGEERRILEKGRDKISQRDV